MALAEMELTTTILEMPESKDNEQSLKQPESTSDLYFDFDVSVHQKLPGVVDRLVEFTGYCTSSSQYRPGRCLVLSGDSGCGKTHLINLVHQNARIDSLVINESDLFKRLRKYYSLKKDTSEIFSQYNRPAMLIYDDLGVPPGNEKWVDGVYYDLFRDNQVYLITTNLSLNEFMERVGPRCFSRLKGAMGGTSAIKRHWIDMGGIPDYRGR